jgi:hypothetical protein
MSQLPPWVRESTAPRADEVERVAGGLDPALLATARAATAPTQAELVRLRSRLPTPRRSWSPAWFGAPVVLAVALLAARAVAPTTVAEVPAVVVHDGVHVISADAPAEVVPGVWVSGRGEVRVAGSLVALDGILRVDADRAFEFTLAGERFTSTAGAFQVAGDHLAVIAGTVRGPGGVTLGAGAGWPVEVAAAAPTAPAVVATAPGPRAAAKPSPAASPEATPPVPAEARPAAAIEAWRELLDARDAGAAGDRLVRMLDGYAAQWPDSPFAAEAADLAALELARSQPSRAALRRLVARLDAAPDGARALELHATAAFLLRESLRDCAGAGPHDAWVAAHATGRRAATAQALLGLCAVREGRDEDARRALEGVDVGLLDPEVAAAVSRARAGSPGEER